MTTLSTMHDDEDGGGGGDGDEDQLLYGWLWVGIRSDHSIDNGDEDDGGSDDGDEDQNYMVSALGGGKK